jgi:hypothetical protein
MWSAVLALTLTLQGRTAAWHKDGHMAIARIAWKQLDQGQQLRISRILKAHPHYMVFLADQRPRDLVTEAEWVFVQAAVWADWVRAPAGPGLDAEKSKAIQKEFNRPVWHYVNLPFVHPRDADRFDAAAIRKEILEPALDNQGQPRHILAALELAMKQLRAAETSEADRAVAVCWLSHLVGDLHQPLHGTALISTSPPFDPPHGDLGGNRLFIKVKADDARGVNLHFYWDALLFRDEPGFAVVDGVAAKLLGDPNLQRDQLPELKATDFPTWAEESLELARKVVYKHNESFIKLHSPPKKGGQPGIDAPSLPDGYQAIAERTAARRMILAGYRLADRLGEALKARE